MFRIGIFMLSLVLTCMLSGQALAASVDATQQNAEQGDAKAQYALGYMYHYNEGLPQNYAKAIEWYTKAANQGLVEAQHVLGHMYEEGEGLTQELRRSGEMDDKSRRARADVRTVYSWIYV